MTTTKPSVYYHRGLFVIFDLKPQIGIDEVLLKIEKEVMQATSRGVEAKSVEPDSIFVWLRDYEKEGQYFNVSKYPDGTFGVYGNVITQPLVENAIAQFQTIT